jgi:hypothetical protein
MSLPAMPLSTAVSERGKARRLTIVLELDTVPVCGIPPTGIFGAAALLFPI